MFTWCSQGIPSQSRKRCNCLISFIGGVGERLKPPVLKTGVHFVDREFESRPLRQKLVLSDEQRVLSFKDGEQVIFR